MQSRIAIYLAFALALLGVCAQAQTPTGTISGQVVDPSGGAVAGAVVTIVNTATNETKQIKTDGAGRYVQPFLQPGKYNVQVEAPGFRTTKQEGVDVEVGVTRPVDFTLPLGTVSSSVKVEATTPPLDTETSTVGQVVTNRQIVDLPLNGRNPFALATLVPGVNNVGGASTPHIGGSRNAVNEEQIDGMTNILPENNVGNTTAAYTPVLDSVQEFSIETNALSAEYGRFGGGVINVVTKSGTNQWHGDAFFFARNAILDASGVFSGGSKPDFHRYQSGGTIGGPVTIPHVYNGRNKTFWFFGFEDTKLAAFQNTVETVPTAAERTGDFSALLGPAIGVNPCTGNTVYQNQIFDPTTAKAVTINGKTVYCRNEIPGNNLAAYVAAHAGQAGALGFDPVAMAAIKYYPNPTGPGLFNNYTAVGTSTNPDDHWDARIDQNFTDKWHMFLRFSHDWNQATQLEDYGNAASTGWGGPTTGGAWSASMDHTISLSPSLVLDFRYGLSRSTAYRTPYGAGFDPASLGLTSISAIAAGEGLQFPRFDMGGINNNQGLGTNGWVRLYENPLAHDFVASATKIAGGHTVKFGGEFRKLFLNFAQYGQPDGYFQFSKNWNQEFVGQANNTGDPIAAFELGLIDNGSTYITHDITAATASSYMAYYVQDDWKITRRLTLNLGLRWDVEFPRTERFNHLSYWDPSVASPLQGLVPASACLACSDLRGAMEFVGTPGSKYGRAQGPVQWKDLGPRVGFAYSITDKTVIRSGFGIAYLPSALEAAGTSGAMGTQGFTSSTNAVTTLTNYQTLNVVNGRYVTLSNPFPNGYNLPTGTKAGAATYIGQGIGDSFFDSYRNPYVMQWNFNVQRQLPGNIILEAGYLGSHSLFLVNGDPGVPYSQVSPAYLPLGSQLETQVANPFRGIITNPTSPLSASTVSYNQLLSPFPQYTSVAAFRKPDAAARYNALILSLNKRFSNGLSLLVSFTGSKTMSNSGAAVTYLGPTAGTYIDQYNPKLQWSVDPQDESKVFSASFLYELPFGRNKRFAGRASGVTNALISGWSINGIVQANTGTPLVIGGAGVDTGLKTVYPEPVDSTGKSAALSHPTNALWFNPSVFVQPAQYTLGDLSRTLPDVRNPGFWNIDFSLFKNNYFGAEGKYNVQFRFEAFNALNHPNFGSPDTNINDSTVGQITSAAANYNPRQLQLALKFIF